MFAELVNEWKWKTQKASLSHLQVTGSLKGSLINWNVGPSNKHILTDKREIQKNELYLYEMEKNLA